MTVEKCFIKMFLGFQLQWHNFTQSVPNGTWEMLPGCNCGASGCSTMAIFTVLRNDGWTHRPPRRERGGAVVMHYIKRGENFFGCLNRAERSHVSLCEKCRPTLHTSYLTLLPFSNALSASFTSAALNRHDVTCTSSASSVVGCDGTPFLCRYLVEGFSVGAPFILFQVALHWHLVQREFMGRGGVCCSVSVWKI